MPSVTSKDGTRIAFDQTGGGAPLILVDGAFGHRKFGSSSELAALLSPDFTVITYDRRGRGDSTDTQPYVVQREIEDLAALMDHIGESVYLSGMSSGAILSLEAAEQLSDRVQKLVLYEPPFIVNDNRPPMPHDFVGQIENAVKTGRRGDAIDLIMNKVLQIPAEQLSQMRHDPSWSEMIKVAHTLVYDATIQTPYMFGEPLPTDRWTHIDCPALVMHGENSPDFFRDGAQALAALLPNIQHVTLTGQEHNVSMEALAPVLASFFNA